MLTIAHLINPVKVSEDSDLFSAQPITFESMRVAREFAGDNLKVQLLTAQFPEDREIIPDFFTVLPDLKKSVLDYQQFSNKKKYPLIKDVLELLYQNSDAEYLIYSNVDIGLMPQFYLAVKKIIEQGFDAFIINRRRISRKYKRVEELPLIWSEAGSPHPGFDCFVFHRNLYPQFILENICIGVPFVEASLAHNLFAFSKNFHLFTDKHLTFHIGMEVMPQRDSAYHCFNQLEFKKNYKQLRPRFNKENLPYSFLPFHQKAIKWALNPAVFILPNLLIEAEGRWNRFKQTLNEIRWRWLAK